VLVTTQQLRTHEFRGYGVIRRCSSFVSAMKSAMPAARVLRAKALTMASCFSRWLTRVWSHRRFRGRGTKLLSKPGVKRMSGGAKRAQRQ
jgi:hypothetical protein